MQVSSPKVFEKGVKIKAEMSTELFEASCDFRFNRIRM